MSGAPAPVWRKASALAAMTLVAAGAVGRIHAQASGGGYSIPRQVVAAGADGTQGASYVLSGTLGQASAGPAIVNDFQLNSGFHRSLGAASDPVFTNGFE